MGTAVFTVTACASPAFLAAFAGAPAVPVALNVTEETPEAAACRLFGPAPVPNVQLVMRARPAASVATAVTGDTDPPPPVTLNVTEAPGTGLLYWSRRSTVGLIGTPEFTVAV